MGLSLLYLVTVKRRLCQMNQPNNYADKNICLKSPTAWGTVPPNVGFHSPRQGEIFQSCIFHLKRSSNGLEFNRLYTSSPSLCQSQWLTALYFQITQILFHQSLYGYLYGCHPHHYNQSAYSGSSVHDVRPTSNSGRTLQGMTCWVLYLLKDCGSWYEQGHCGNTFQYIGMPFQKHHYPWYYTWSTKSNEVSSWFIGLFIYGSKLLLFSFGRDSKRKYFKISIISLYVVGLIIARQIIHTL